MNLNGQLGEYEEFRIVLVLPWLMLVLVEQHDDTHRLPRITIRRRVRTAEQLNQVFRARWGVRSLVIDQIPGTHELPPCVVIEVRSRDWKFAQDGFELISIDDMNERDLTAPERLTVCNIIAGNTQDRGPFSKLGWIEEAQAWIQDNVPSRRIEFDQDPRQLSAGGTFALVRFGTVDGSAYWLKAVGASNTEFAITQALARYCALFVPPLIAARTDWNAWVTQEAGQPLHDAICLHAFEQATHCLAELQIASSAHVDGLLACGCFDQRMSVLRSHLPELIQYLEDAMARQTSTKVAPLDGARLSELGRILQDASEAMDAIDVPETLIHNDMNQGNILFDGGRAVFTDWSEACIGTPFVTFQHLYAQALEADQTHTWAPRLREIYINHWKKLLTVSQVEKAFALSKPLAVASHLCGRDPSFTATHRGNDSAQSYARSLARHMDRLARAPEFLEALCN